MKFQLIFLCCFLQSIVGLPTSSRSISSRIIGGIVAPDGSAPYQCSIQTDGHHFCGCAIISSEWILTTARCIYSEKPENINIYTGSNRLRADGTLYNAQKIILHEKYNKPDHNNDEGHRPHLVNDIGLIRVKGTIKFNNKTQPIKYSKSFIEEGTDLKMTGWGSNTDSSPIRNLRLLYTLAMSKTECSHYMLYLYEGHLCTMTKEENGGFKFGDYGGPLVSGNELVGLASWYMWDGKTNWPNGYTRISSYYDWIQEHTSE